MNLDKAFTVIGSIIVLAMLTTVLTAPNTVGVIKAGSGGFIGSLKAAMGK